MTIPENHTYSYDKKYHEEQINIHVYGKQRFKTTAYVCTTLSVAILVILIVLSSDALKSKLSPLWLNLRSRISLL